MYLCAGLCRRIAEDGYAPADMRIGNAEFSEQRTYTLIVAYVSRLIYPAGTDAEIGGTQEDVFEHTADFELLIVVAALYTCKYRGSGRIHGVSRAMEYLTEHACQLLHVFVPCYDAEVSFILVKCPRCGESGIYKLSENIVAQLP